MGRTTKREKPIFAKNATARAKALGWNWHELARRARMPHPTLRDILAGISPGREENRKAIAEALGCTMADLYVDPSKSAPRMEKTVGELTPDELVQKIVYITKQELTSGERELLYAWSGAGNEPYRRGLAMFFLTGDQKHLMEVPIEFRRKILAGLDYFGMNPSKKARALKK